MASGGLDAREYIMSLERAESVIADVKHQLRQCGEEIQRLNQDKQRLIHDNQQLERKKVAKEKQLGRVTNQLEESERATADLERRVVELEGELNQREQPQRPGDRANGETEIKLTWREEKAPCKISRDTDAVVGGSVVYCYEMKSTFGSDKEKIHTYHINTSEWSVIRDTPPEDMYALAVINGTLTTVGGRGDGYGSNKLFSLTKAGEDGEQTWIIDLPRMPTKRYEVSALCIGTALIVVGGRKEIYDILKTVEILNISTRQWHTAADLPVPLARSSMTVCGDRIYLLGGYYDWSHPEYLPKYSTSVDTCSLTTLIMSQKSRMARALSRSSTDDTWTTVDSLPVSGSAAVSIHGQLIAVGGQHHARSHTSDIHRYNPATKSWEVISHMPAPRYKCLAAVLPDNQLMVIGGWGGDDKLKDSVLFGRVEIY